jgi:glycosyltransferase involved in cell wall biosynthesis
MSPPALRKVLMTADTLGGVWTFALDLCTGLAKHGVEVMLLAMGRMPDDAQRVEADALPNVRLVATQHRLEWMQDSAADVIESGRLLMQLAKSFKPDVVHANEYYHATLPFDAPVLLTAHSCVSSWWRACRGGTLPTEWRPYEAWVTAAVQAADMLVAPTDAFLEEFQNLHGYAHAARAIWNGRSAELFRPAAKKSVVLAAGRLWDEAKNIGLLCRAAEGLDVPVRVAGETVSPDGGVPGLSNVDLLGRLTPAQIAAEMEDAAIFAAPARYEPFGLTVLEAALGGCALVLSDIATFRELWDGAAEFVDPNDVDGWRAALSQLAGNRKLAAEQGNKACAQAQLYSVERMTHGYLGAYGNAIASSASLLQEAAA